MKKILFLLLCIISHNSMQTSAPASTAAPCPASKKFLVRINCSQTRNILQAHGETLTDQSLSLFDDVDVNEQTYRECKDVIRDGKIIGMDSGPTQNPHPELKKAIEIARTGEKVCNFYRKDLSSLWLVTNDELTLVKLHHNVIAKEMYKRFAHCRSTMILDECKECRERHKDELRAQGEVLDCDLWPDQFD